MKNLKLRLVSAFMTAVIMAGTSAVPVCAEDMQGTVETADTPDQEELEEILREYVGEVLPVYLDNFYDFDTMTYLDGDFYITDIIPQYNWEKGSFEGRYIVFISYNRKMVAQLAVNYNEGEAVSSMWYSESPLIHEALETGQPFKIGYGYDDFLLYMDGVIMEGDSGVPVKEQKKYVLDESEMTTAGYDYAVVTVTENYCHSEVNQHGALITERDADTVITYFSSSDNLKKGWNIADGKKYYVGEDGNKLTKSANIDGIRYRFSSDGECLGKYTGWTKSKKGRRYYRNGKYVTEKWLRGKSGKCYYADEKGYITEYSA